MYIEHKSKEFLFRSFINLVSTKKNKIKINDHIAATISNELTISSLPLQAKFVFSSRVEIKNSENKTYDG